VYALHAIQLDQYILARKWMLNRGVPQT